MMAARTKKLERIADRYELPYEHVAFMRRRTAFLLERANLGPDRPLADLLANAYAQGCEDTVAVMERRRMVAWPDDAPAQQDGWAR